jgi:hypothetical protein
MERGGSDPDSKHVKKDLENQCGGDARKDRAQRDLVNQNRTRIFRRGGYNAFRCIIIARSAHLRSS